MFVDLQCRVVALAAPQMKAAQAVQHDPRASKKI